MKSREKRWLQSLCGARAKNVARLMSQVFSNKAARAVFQPLVRLESREIFAYESLARCDIEELKSPPILFETAVETGRVGELGRFLRQLSMDGCTTYPLFVNIHPHEFDEGWLVQPDDPIYWHGEEVYIEITESVPIHYFQQCHGVLKEARSKGVKLAVDDLGAGFSNLKYIADLKPEVVKLDRELVAGVSIGTRQFRLLKGIVRLCEEMGAEVVAEGIETEQELRGVIEAGAHYGQGFLLARPAFPPPAITWPERIAPPKKF